jgi:glutaconate CoA-transferase subunit B
MYFAVPRVILFREEHSPRTLVERVDFVSAPGPALSGPGVWRRGGPKLLVTGLCVMAFDDAAGRFRLESRHPGVTVEQIVAATGFAFDHDAEVPETPAPPLAHLDRLRREIAPRVAGFYPDFAARVFGVAPEAASR